MDNCEDSNSDFTLSKSEILRGYNSFYYVLQNSKTISTEYLKAFVNKQVTDTAVTEFNKRPLFTGNVKVGFIIAKKKIKKSVKRNRIKRLFKESYRLTKTQTGLFGLKLNIIFTLNDKGYMLFQNNKKIKTEFLKNEMILLSSKINLKYSSL